MLSGTRVQLKGEQVRETVSVQEQNLYLEYRRLYVYAGTEVANFTETDCLQVVPE